MSASCWPGRGLVGFVFCFVFFAPLALPAADNTPQEGVKPEVSSSINSRPSKAPTADEKDTQPLSRLSGLSDRREPEETRQGHSADHSDSAKKPSKILPPPDQLNKGDSNQPAEREWLCWIGYVSTLVLYIALSIFFATFAVRKFMIRENAQGKEWGAKERDVLLMWIISSWGIGVAIMAFQAWSRPFCASQSASAVEAKDILEIMIAFMSFFLGLIAYVRWRDDRHIEDAKKKLDEEIKSIKEKNDEEIKKIRREIADERRAIEQEVRERIGLAIAEMREDLAHQNHRDL